MDELFQKLKNLRGDSNVLLNPGYHNPPTAEYKHFIEETITLVSQMEQELIRLQKAKQIPLKQTLDNLEKSVLEAAQGLDDWIVTHASDMCDADTVLEAQNRIGKVGTLGYACEVRDTLLEAFAKIKQEIK